MKLDIRSIIINSAQLHQPHFHLIFMERRIFIMSKFGLFTAIFLIIAGETLSFDLPQRSNADPLEWWQEEVVYQIYPRSHQDSDGDGVGDLKGIQDRLDHFVDLGIGSVWISPIYKSPMADFGYDISDFTDIDPMFGTMEDFRNLSAAMKERGIKLIMDFVPNHSSDKHEWFQKSIKKEGKYADYYVWENPKGWEGEGNNRKPIPPNNWRSVFGRSAWEWNVERQQYYLHQFTIGQPDLNFRNKEVVIEIRNAIYFWLNQGVDGFRVDAVPHLFEDPSLADEAEIPNPPPTANCTVDHICLNHTLTYNLPEVFPLLEGFRKLLDIFTSKDGNPRVMMVESSVPTLDELFEYYGNESNPIAHYPFNFEFLNRIKPDFSGKDLSDLVDEWFTKMPNGKTANWLLGNHDIGRVGSRFTPDVIDPFNMINLLLPGAAVTYYGEEIGMLNADLTYEETRDPPACDMGPDRYRQFSRDPARTPMQWNGNEKNAGFSTNESTWLPLQEDWESVNVEAQKNSPQLTHLKVYKSLIELRKTDIWRYGSMQSKSIQNGDLFGFTRVYNDEGFIYLGNFANAAKTVDVSTEFAGLDKVEDLRVYQTSVGFSGAKRGDVLEGTTVDIPAKHAIILRWAWDFTPETTTQDSDRTTRESDTTTDKNGGGGGGGGGASFAYISALTVTMSVVFSSLYYSIAN